MAPKHATDAGMETRRLRAKGFLYFMQRHAPTQYNPYPNDSEPMLDFTNLGSSKFSESGNG